MTVASLPPGLATLAAERGRSHDIVDDVLERLAACAGDAAFISLVDPASLRARADELEMLLRRGVELPLYGVPFAVAHAARVFGIRVTADHRGARLRGTGRLVAACEVRTVAPL